MSGEEKIVAQHHRSATENRYTHTPHAYGSAIPTIDIFNYLPSLNFTLVIVSSCRY